ncbi:FecR family protein [Sphingomonas panaciterrae]|uniref:FecR family protein n=1 Tax=Sphingomonas panaciterrae TaxID=1462999 RepID=UPI002FF3A466
MSRTDEAADWAARLDAAALDAPARAGLDAWLAADPLNKGALLRAQAMLCLVYDAPGATLVDAPAPAAAPPRRRHRWALAALPAAAALAGVAVTVAWQQPDHARFATETGEIRRVALEDGSHAIINTDTRIDTAIDRSERLVALDTGEAWFQVAKDKSRPFVVSAGPIRVRATGTAFAVRRDADAVTVTVTEGAVEMWNSATPSRRTPARAGQSAKMAFASPVNRLPRLIPAHESALAWRDGDIVLDGMTLGQAAAEFNRYNLRKIRVEAPGATDTPMLGYFKINQPEQFALAASGIVNGSVRHDGNNLVITTSETRN